MLRAVPVGNFLPEIGQKSAIRGPARPVPELRRSRGG
jgi:hypothetical protein